MLRQETNAEGLQKVTHSENAAKLKTLEETFSRKRIGRNDLPEDSKERSALLYKIQEHINSLEGSELDDYLEKIDSIIPADSDIKSIRWEITHMKIYAWIGKLIQEKHRLPTVSEIAHQSKYSRKTIHAHLKDFESSPFYEEEKQKFKILHNTILNRLFEFGFDGDVKACRLFLEATEGLKPKENTRNYIQINSLVVTDEVIKGLPESRVKEIESIIRNSLAEIRNHSIGLRGTQNTGAE